MDHNKAIINAVIIIGKGTKFPDFNGFIACTIKVLDDITLQELQQKYEFKSCRFFDSLDSEIFITETIKNKNIPKITKKQFLFC